MPVGCQHGEPALVPWVGGMITLGAGTPAPAECSGGGAVRALRSGRHPRRAVAVLPLFIKGLAPPSPRARKHRPLRPLTPPPARPAHCALQLTKEAGETNARAMMVNGFNYKNKVAPKCSVQTGGDWTAHFNTNSQPTYPDYSQVCKRGACCAP